MSVPTPRPPLLRVLGTHVLVGVAVVLAGFGFLVAASDGWGVLLAVEAAALLGGCWLVLLLATLLPGTARRGRLVVRRHPDRLELPGSRLLTGLLVALLALSLLLPLTLLVSWAARGRLDGSAGAVVLSLALLPLGVPLLVQVLRGRVRVPCLVLDAEGVTSRGWRGETAVAWAELAEVRLVADPGRRLVLRATSAAGRRTTPTSVATSPGARTVGGPVVGADEVSVPVAFMGSDAALVADLLAACRTDPTRWSEL
ncbi:hypothetical protein [Nocardioides dokdonensis]|uniref:hypothetical protein n=1 Tax=Nocardioides dokdonensis TaxID=450734 RepID=UPI001470E701|nr:hypothetical protein [Nocardioides dokdonensis]